MAQSTYTTGHTFTENGSVGTKTSGFGLVIKEGTNARMGLVTLNGTSNVTVTTTAVAANSRIFLTTQTPSGTLGCPVVVSKAAGASFIVKSTVAGDVSTVAWMIVEPG